MASNRAVLAGLLTICTALWDTASAQPMSICDFTNAIIAAASDDFVMYRGEAKPADSLGDSFTGTLSPNSNSECTAFPRKVLSGMDEPAKYNCGLHSRYYFSDADLESATAVLQRAAQDLKACFSDLRLEETLEGNPANPRDGYQRSLTIEQTSYDVYLDLMVIPFIQGRPEFVFVYLDVRNRPPTAR